LEPRLVVAADAPQPTTYCRPIRPSENEATTARRLVGELVRGSSEEATAGWRREVIVGCLPSLFAYLGRHRTVQRRGRRLPPDEDDNNNSNPGSDGAPWDVSVCRPRQRSSGGRVLLPTAKTTSTTTGRLALLLEAEHEAAPV
jgi:hypothetical protein